jgi:serine/threonine protein kinase
VGQPGQTPWWRRWWPARPAAGGAARRPAAATEPGAAGPGKPAARPPGTPSQTRFGRFRLEAQLGQGASGPVYLAWDGTQRVALKLLALPGGLDADDRQAQQERFLRQAQALRRLAHPDIVAVLDHGEEAGQAWMTMEPAPGFDLTRYARGPRLLPEPIVLELGARLALALAHAHAQGIVHRDLKPANIRLDLPAKTLKLMDFGVARLEDAAITRTGVTLGTPAYMAPEQLTGDVADARSDTYALGVILYELLTGRLPYAATSLGELLRAVGAGDPPRLRYWRPASAPALEHLLAQLMAREPRSRPADLVVLAAELRALAAGPQAPIGSAAAPAGRTPAPDA